MGITFSGRKVAGRVWVLSPSSGAFLYSLTKEAARKVLESGEVTPELSSGPISRVYPASTSGTPSGVPSPLTAYSYQGQHYSYRQRSSTCPPYFQFRNILSCDQWAFRLAQTDCLTSGSSRNASGDSDA